LIEHVSLLSPANIRVNFISSETGIIVLPGAENLRSYFHLYGQNTGMGRTDRQNTSSVTELDAR